MPLASGSHSPVSWLPEEYEKLDFMGDGFRKLFHSAHCSRRRFREFHTFFYVKVDSYPVRTAEQVHIQCFALVDSVSPAARGQISTVPREGALRIPRSVLAGLTVSVLSIFLGVALCTGTGPGASAIRAEVGWRRRPGSSRGI